MGRRKASNVGEPWYVSSNVPPRSSYRYIGLTQPPHAWAVIPPDFTISRHVEVLLSVDATVYSVDNLEATDQRLSRGPFTHLAPSPNGKSLALLTLSGALWVVSTDFQRSLADFDTSTVAASAGEVRQVEWCGNDAVFVTFEHMALLVGPFGETLQYVLVLHPRTCSAQPPKQILLLWCDIRHNRARWRKDHQSRRLRVHSESAW